MLLIKIQDFDQNNLTVINSYLSLSMTKEISNVGKLNITLPYNEEIINKMTETNRKVGNTIKIAFPKNGVEYNLWQGCIMSVKLQGEYIKIEAMEYMGWTKKWENNRVLGADKNYSTQPLKDIITDLYSTFGGMYDLPFSLGINNDETSMGAYFEAGLTFVDCLNKLYEDNNILWRTTDTLDIGNIGETKLGLWKYDNNDRNGSSIVDFEWEDSVYQLQKNPNIVPYPKIKLDTNRIDRRDYKIGDTKMVQIRTSLEGGEIGFLGTIRKIDIKASGTILDVKIEVSDSDNKNVAEGLFEIMKKIKDG